MNNKNIERAKAQKNLELQFQQLGKKTKMPADLKTAVFSSLDTVNLLADIADLFTVKFTLTNMVALGISGEQEDFSAPIDKKFDNQIQPENKETKE